MKKLILFVIILSSVELYSHDIRLETLIDSAIVKMDNGLLDESEQLLNEVLKREANNYFANYELAYLYTIKKQYDRSITILDKIKDSSNLNDCYYQLLGTNYDYKGMKSAAIETFKAGIKAFPNSGLLHVELGMMYHQNNDIITALDTYESGIQVDPMFPSNYYYAGLILLGSSEPSWGFLYGEIFMNLEPYTNRSKTMSKYLYETIKSNISITDTVFTANFTQQNSISFNSTTMSLEMSFPLLYETCFNAGGRKALDEGLDTLELYSLGRIHEYQIEYGKNYYNGNFEDPLYVYLLRVQNAGFIDAYCIHLFKGGAPDDYAGWIVLHKEHYLEFMKWREENPLILTPTHYLSRKTFPNIQL